MVMCILSAVVCLPMIVFASIGFSEKRGGTSLIFFFGSQMIVALVSALSAIFASSISCQVVCCRKQSDNPENPEAGQYEIPSAPPQVEVDMQNIGKLHFINQNLCGL